MNINININCRQVLIVMFLLVSLFLCLVKAVIGIFGSCESLVADGLFSLYASFILLKHLFTDKNMGTLKEKGFLIAGILIAVVLILGIFDITVFSIVRLIKASKGLLGEPSIYVIFVAAASVLASLVFIKWILDSSDGNAADGKIQSSVPDDINEIMKTGIIISSVVIAGCILSKTVSVCFDEIAAIFIVCILISRVIFMIRSNYKLLAIKD